MRCPGKTEVWTRVCGFFRPVSQFNRGKKAEYKERVNYSLEPNHPPAPSLIKEGEHD